MLLFLAGPYNAPACLVQAERKRRRLHLTLEAGTGSMLKTPSDVQLSHAAICELKETDEELPSLATGTCNGA